MHAATLEEVPSSANGSDAIVADVGEASPLLTADLARLVEYTERARLLRFETAPRAWIATSAHLASLSQTQRQTDARHVLSIDEAIGLDEPTEEAAQAPSVFLDATNHRLLLDRAQLEENHLPRAPTRALSLELMRALSLELLRQRFGDAPLTTVDASNARWALREGDAALVAGGLEGALPGQGRIAIDAHAELLRDAGLHFAQALHERHGLASLNLAHAQPPTTSEQILHPRLFIEGEPAPEPFALPACAAMQVAGFAAEPDETLGEFEISLFFGRGFGPGRDAEAAAGWDGDRIRVYTRRSNDAYESAFVWVMRWDTVTDAEEAERASRRLAVSDGVVVRRQGRWLLLHLGLGANATAEAEAAFAAVIAAHPPQVTAEDAPELATSPSGARSRDSIRTGVHARMDELRACYEAQLAFEPSLQGRVTTFFVVSPEGRAGDIEIEDSSLGATRSAAQVTDCLQALLETMQFPPEPGTQALGVTYPFVFHAEEE